MENTRVLKHEELIEAVYLRLNEPDGESFPPQSYLESTEMNKKFHSFCEKFEGKEDANDLYCELVDLVFSYNRESFRMGYKTAVSLIFQKDLIGAEDEHE